MCVFVCVCCGEWAMGATGGDGGKYNTLVVEAKGKDETQK